MVALVALGGVAAFFGLSDWKKREVDLRGVLLAYCGATCVSAGLVLSGQATGIEPATAFSIFLLSGAVFAFWKLGLLAFGDVVAIPAMLLMLLTSTALAVMLYFMTAMSFVVVIALAKNVRNNMRYRTETYGPWRQKIHLMLFCYYGDGTVRHAFQYGGNATRRDYDNEGYYAGKEKTWLVPGLPLLSGFLPAMMVLVLLS
jgi:hypothetical protein